MIKLSGKQCGDPPRSPENGHVSCSNNNVLDSVCEFSCDRGFYLAGYQFTTCVEDYMPMEMRWDNQAPVCKSEPDYPLIMLCRKNHAIFCSWPLNFLHYNSNIGIIEVMTFFWSRNGMQLHSTTTDKWIHTMYWQELCRIHLQLWMCRLLWSRWFKLCQLWVVSEWYSTMG